MKDSGFGYFIFWLIVVIIIGALIIFMGKYFSGCNIGDITGIKL